MTHLPTLRRLPRLSLLLVVLLTCSFLSSGMQSPPVSNMDRDRGRLMLNVIKNELKKNYYDPNFHGMNVDARFKTAEEKMKEATSLGQVFGIVAQVLIDLNDSHTFFLPPSRTTRTDYGWQMQMIGSKCYVGAVKPGSDAEAKGLKPGDEVYSVDGLEPTRENLWKIQYLYYTLRPRPGMRVVLHSSAGERQVDVMAKVRQQKLHVDLTGSDVFDLIREAENEDRLLRQRTVEFTDQLMVWKMPEFNLEDHAVDDLMDKARKRKALILDLRGNPGGSEQTLLRMIGHLFDKDITVAELKRRKETKPLIAKTRGDRAFKGRLVVLVDSRSGSSAEILSRVVQLEKRGTVIGDRTAGAVMRAIHHGFQMGADTVVFYGASITDADLIMADGKSLEHEGVTPDELLIPSAGDLASLRDPVLARAAELVGYPLTAEKAGTMFPIEWRK